MKPFIKFAAALLLMLAASSVTPCARAQISVGPGGVPVQNFSTLPPSSEWAMRSIPGGVGDITTLAGLAAEVQTNSASLITSPLVTAPGTPPTASGNALYASDMQMLCTRANGNRCTLLMATLRNDSGLALSGLAVAHELGVYAPTTEQVPGYAVYFSLTGLTGSWQAVPGLSGTNGSLTRTAALPLGFWPTNALLYLVWADDNSSASPDTAYTIDNFSAQIILAAPVITNQPASQSVAPGGAVSFSVGVSGTEPFSYQWRQGGTNLSGATNQTLALVNAQPGDAGNYSVFITNAFGSALSGGATLTVSCTAPVVITTQPLAQTLVTGAAISLGVTASGTQPLSYQWRRNGLPLAGATNAAFTLTNAQHADSGFYSVQVGNCLGSVLSSNAAVSIANAPVVLVGLTNHFWKYDQSGNDLGTAWRAPGFNDAAWPAGRGIFAREDNASIVPLTNTVLSLNPGPGQIATYYFRTHFNYTGETVGVQLVSSNYFDDSAVVYLNGVEAFRENMPGGTVSSATLANTASTEGVFVTSNLPPALLLPGDNVLAVEVHQVNLTSSDVAFGMQLTLVPLPPTPLQFTNQPASAVVLEGRAASFSGAVSGSFAYFQWFKNGVLIPGATASALALSNVAPGAAGAYTLQASNHFGVVLSAAATLTVLPDESAPVLLSADLLTPTQIQLVFSEPVLLLTATNKLNYQITNTFGGQFVVQSAVLTNQTNVLLTVTALAAGVNYIATALNIADTGPNQNALPATSAPVARLIPLTSFDATWDYYDPFPIFGDPEPGPDWREQVYDTSFWGQGAGAFRFSTDESLVAPVTVGTTLNQSPTPAAFFRHPFSSSGLSPGGLRLTLRAHVNDAAAFYLNGVELFRTNLPVGIITPTTPAVVSAGSTLVSSVREISAPLLRAGSNLLAVELHQFTEFDAQKFFAAELVARAESLLVGPLRVLGGPSDATVLENRPVTFRVSSVAASAFQWQVNGGNVFGATNSSFTFPASIFFDGAQIRCAVSQPGTTNFTTNATVHVVPDTVRSALLGARLNADGTMTLSFSEPLAAATAQDILRYAVTNAVGPSATITGAVLTNGTDVVLTFAAPLAGRYTVVVNGVTDLANVPNAVLPGSAALVSAIYFIPMTSAWKYLLINTNETVQAAYMQVNYDDSTWRGPSNALLYVETDALPAPKNTPLSMFDSIMGNRINTFYFRQQFVAPISATNVTVQLSHIIDDGLQLYLNGREIYRYNLPAGTVTASSQGVVSVGNATLLGPFAILNLTNLVTGTNVLAAEVHNNGLNNSDIVMGVELSFEIPGGVLPLPWPSLDARLALVPSGGSFALMWSEPDFALESAPGVSGPWTPVASPSPVFISPTNAAAFYRLRR